MNMTVIEDIVESIGNGNGFIVLDQNVDGLEAMAMHLKQKGVSKVAGSGIPIYNNRGKRSNIFNTYLVQPEQKHDARRSLLISEALINHLRARIKNV